MKGGTGIPAMLQGRCPRHKMKLGSFKYDGRTFVGTIFEPAQSEIGQAVVDLQAAFIAYLRERGESDPQALGKAALPDDILGFLRGGKRCLDCARIALGYVEESWHLDPDAFRQAASEGDRPIVHRRDSVRLMAPVPCPPKLICIGLNYRDHAREANSPIPKAPVLFSKFCNAIAGPNDPIIIPKVSSEIDYEAELAIVIGKQGKHISRDDALGYVAGYTILNDVSARDLQMSEGQWLKGKTLDSFAPMGPFLITSDEIPNPGELDIKLWLNGALMQDSNTRELIFDVPALIEYISNLMTLTPGDVIATGTPSGVGFTRKPPIFLKPGDTVSIEIERLGTLTNPVIAEENDQ